MTEYSQEFFDFIDKPRDDDPQKLRLKWAGKAADFDVALAITQIECRRKYARKLADTLARAHDRFIFPDTLAGEQ